MRDTLGAIILAAMCWILGWVSRPTWRYQLAACRQAQIECAYQLDVDVWELRQAAGVAKIEKDIGAWYFERYTSHCARDFRRLEGKQVEPGAAIGPIGGR